MRSRPAEFVVSCVLAFSAVLAPAQAQDTPRAWLDPSVRGEARERAESIIGKAVADIASLTPMNGAAEEAVGQGDLRGKVIVVQVWDRRSRGGELRLRHAATFAAQASSEEVVVLAVHAPDAPEAVRGFVERREPAVAALLDASGDFLRAMSLESTTSNIVVDRQGAVRYAGLSPAGVAGAVQELIAIPFDPDAETPAAAGAGAPVRQADGRWVRMDDSLFPEVTGAITNARDLRGDEGPRFVVEKWITPEVSAADKVLVLDFWATWCGPCVMSIPHLNQVASKHADALVVVGVSAEAEQNVANFVETRGMRYGVAIDPQRRMYREVGVRAIPHVLVMSPDGVVRWQGNPLSSEFEPALDQIVSAVRTRRGG